MLNLNFGDLDNHIVYFCTGNLQAAGLEFGTAYQLMNDLLDYSMQSNKAGEDVRERKITMPLLLALVCVLITCDFIVFSYVTSLFPDSSNVVFLETHGPRYEGGRYVSL